MENPGFIFLGASKFPKSPTFDDGGNAFKLSYQRLQRFAESQLRDSLTGNLLDLFDSELSAPDQIDEIEAFLNIKNHNLSDLIIFYIGHGSLTAEGENYYLAIRSTRENQPYFTSIASDMLARTLRIQGRGLRKFLFLDACFAAAFATKFQSPLVDVVRAQICAATWEEGTSATSGTALLCASSKSKPAKFLEHGTMFSDALATILEEGREGYGKFFSLEDLHNLINRYIKEKYGAEGVRPELHVPDQRQGMIHTAPLFVNRLASKNSKFSSEIENEFVQSFDVKNSGKNQITSKEISPISEGQPIDTEGSISDWSLQIKGASKINYINVGGIKNKISKRVIYLILTASFAAVAAVIFFPSFNPTPPSSQIDSRKLNSIDSANNSNDTSFKNSTILAKTLVYFDFDKSVLKPESRKKLDELIAQVENSKIDVFTIIGHTDNASSEAYAQKFSARKAEAVKAYLVSKGVEKNRIYTEGAGFSRPVASNSTIEGRARNRRAEIEVQGCRLPC